MKGFVKGLVKGFDNTISHRYNSKSPHTPHPPTPPPLTTITPTTNHKPQTTQTTQTNHTNTHTHPPPTNPTTHSQRDGQGMPCVARLLPSLEVAAVSTARSTDLSPQAISNLSWIIINTTEGGKEVWCVRVRVVLYCVVVLCVLLWCIVCVHADKMYIMCGSRKQPVHIIDQCNKLRKIRLSIQERSVWKCSLPGLFSAVSDSYQPPWASSVGRNTTEELHRDSRKRKKTGGAPTRSRFLFVGRLELPTSWSCPPSWLIRCPFALLESLEVAPPNTRGQTVKQVMPL